MGFPGGKPNRALIVLAVGVLDLGLEQGIVAPALPAIERRFRASPTAGTWLLTGFLLAAAVAIPLAGRIGDQFGRRRMLTWSLALFALGSLICALAGSIDLLIVGRVVQGLGAGVGPLALALARDRLPAERLTTAVGLLLAAGSAGAVAGLLLAGVLVDRVSVPAIFWVLFATALTLVVLVRLAIPESSASVRAPLDIPGGLALAGALGSLTLAISRGDAWGWGSPRTVLLLATATGLLGAFAVRERTATDPLIDPRALRLRSIWSANLAMGGLGFSLLIVFALVPLIGAYPRATGYGLGLSTTQIGLVLVPSGLATLVAGVVGGRLIPRTGSRAQALAGTLLAAVTYVMLARVHPSVALLALATIPLGAGVGLALGAITDLVALSAPAARTAATLGLNTVIRTVAAALGAQIAIAVVTAAPPVFGSSLRLGTHGPTGGIARLPPHVLTALRIPAQSGFTNAFWVAAAGTGVSLLAIALTPSRRADPARAPVRALGGVGAAPGAEGASSPSGASSR